jgi:hypothetical protein
MATKGFGHTALLTQLLNCREQLAAWVSTAYESSAAHEPTWIAGLTVDGPDLKQTDLSAQTGIA